MGEQTQFSDDISALWGSDDPGILEPAPRRKPDVERGADDRLDELEQHVRRMTNAAGAGRAAFRAGIVAEVRAEVEERLRASEARAHAQLYDLAGQVAGALGSVVERLAALERDMAAALAGLSDAQAALAGSLGEMGVRAGAVERRTALLADAVEAYRREAVGPGQLDALRQRLEAADEEAAVRTEARLSGRLDDLSARIGEVRAATERLAEVDRAIAELARNLEAASAEGSDHVHAAVDASGPAPA